MAVWEAFGRQKLVTLIPKVWFSSEKVEDENRGQGVGQPAWKTALLWTVSLTGVASLSSGVSWWINKDLFLNFPGCGSVFLQLPSVR